MGNISFIVPTQKIEDFTIDRVVDILKNKFSDIKFDVSQEFKQVSCSKEGDFITEMYFEQDCYLFEECDIDQDIEYLKDIDREYLIPKYKEFIESKPDLKNVIQMTFGSPYLSEERFEITDVLRKYFKSYTFDEGIHPEFMPPDYERTQSSIDFFKKLKNLFI